MWHRIVNLFSRVKPIFVPTHDGNVLLITGNIRAGTVSVSYKGKVKVGKFTDSTLRNMMKGVRFRKSTESFLGCVAHLLEQLTDQENASKEKGI